MYAGHMAVGVAIKAAAPGVKAWPIILGTAFLDFMYGLLTIAGVEHATPNLDAGPYLFFDLTFIDWDHSLLMAIVLSLVWGAFFLKDKRLAILAAIAVFSHFLTDLPVHSPDLALYPYSETHFGFGLWDKLGTTSWVLEGVFVGLLAAWAWNKFKARGAHIGWVVFVLAFMFFNNSPWTSTMKQVATLTEPTLHLVHGTLVFLGFLIPGLIMSWLIDRAEKKAA